jgi:copper resistance protein C
VQTSPAEVRIWLSEKIERTLSTIRVFDAAGKQVDLRNAQLDGSNRALLQVSLPVLKPGTYKVVWRVASIDTHITNGSFRFRVVP